MFKQCNLVQVRLIILIGSPWKWGDDSAANYFAWAPGEPNDQDGSHNCVEMWTTSWPGLWNDQACSDLKPYVCMTEKGN